MHVSYAEMARSAPEVLRMLGNYPYGLAAEAVEGFMMTHAALGKGYALSRLSRSASGGRSLEVSEAGAGVLHVEGGGAAFVLYAGLIADAFSSRSRGGHARLQVTGLPGGWVAPYVAYRIARNGVSCSGTWRAQGEASADEAPPIWLSAQATHGTSPVIVLMAELETDENIAEGFSVSTHESAGPPSGRAELAQIDFDSAVRRAIETGFEADENEHRSDFTDIAARIRIAFSERSRQQAG